MKRKNCDFCQHHIPVGYDRCPHCGRPRLFPNVELANDPDHVTALNHRYQLELNRARSRGCVRKLKEFQSLVESSKAVLACSISKLHNLTVKDGIFANYYDLSTVYFLPNPTPGKPDWNKRRPQVEIEFVGSEKHIHAMHYANLTLDCQSLPHYGECTVLLNDGMIQHRASVFQENSALYFHQSGPNLPSGSRCDWGNRGKLAVAKYGKQFTRRTKKNGYPQVLQKAGTSGTGLDDEFLEVQIFGEMTIHTFESIRLRLKSKKGQSTIPQGKRRRTRRGSTIEQAIKRLSDHSGVHCEIV